MIFDNTQWYSYLKRKFSPSKHKSTIQINQLHVSATVSSHHQADPKNIKKEIIQLQYRSGPIYLDCTVFFFWLKNLHFIFL